MEEAPVPDSLQRQNQELRRRLDEDSANYRRRLDTYRQAQKHQATLVSRLQAKVSNIPDIGPTSCLFKLEPNMTIIL